MSENESSIDRFLGDSTESKPVILSGSFASVVSVIVSLVLAFGLGSVVETLIFLSGSLIFLAGVQAVVSAKERDGGSGSQAYGYGDGVTKLRSVGSLTLVLGTYLMAAGFGLGFSEFSDNPTILTMFVCVTVSPFVIWLGVTELFESNDLSTAFFYTLNNFLFLFVAGLVLMFVLSGFGGDRNVFTLIDAVSDAIGSYFGENDVRRIAALLIGVSIFAKLAQKSLETHAYFRPQEWGDMEFKNSFEKLSISFRKVFKYLIWFGVGFFIISIPDPRWFGYYGILSSLPEVLRNIYTGFLRHSLLLSSVAFGVVILSVYIFSFRVYRRIKRIRTSETAKIVVSLTGSLVISFLALILIITLPVEEVTDYYVGLYSTGLAENIVSSYESFGVIPMVFEILAAPLVLPIVMLLLLLAFLELELIPRRTNGVAAGSAFLFVGGITSALIPQSVHSLVTLFGVAGAYIVWDAGENSISLGNTVGRKNDTQTVEVLHILGTVIVGVVFLGLGYASLVFLPSLTAPGEASIIALILLTIAIITLMSYLGTKDS